MKKWVDRFNGALLALMFLATFYQVLARNVLFTTAMWTEELAKFLFVYIVFIGSATLMENEGHIRIAILSDRLPGPLARWHRLFVQLVLTAFGDGSSIQSALELRAEGFALKTESPIQLIEAIRQVANGRIIFPAAAQRWFDELKRRYPEIPDLDRIQERISSLRAS